LRGSRRLVGGESGADVLDQLTAPSDQHVVAPTEDKYALILREVTALFPQQIKSIVSDGGIVVDNSDAGLHITSRRI
jgi:hypothetical protein